MNEPNKLTLAKFAETLQIEFYKAIELVKFAHTQMREDLIHWLNHPEQHFSQRDGILDYPNDFKKPLTKIRIDYKEGGFSLIWFDKELNTLQMYSAGGNKGKTIQNIKETDEF